MLTFAWPAASPDLGQRTITDERVTDERVPAMMDREAFEAGGAQNLARCAETFAERVA